MYIIKLILGDPVLTSLDSVLTVKRNIFLYQQHFSLNCLFLSPHTLVIVLLQQPHSTAMIYDLLHLPSTLLKPNISNIQKLVNHRFTISVPVLILLIF